MGCHTAEQAEKAVADIKEFRKKANVVGLACDLASFKSVEDFVASFKKSKWFLSAQICYQVYVCRPEE